MLEGGHDLSHLLENCKVHVNNFTGVRVKYVQDYVKPLRENPHHLIIHGTNDISTNKQPEQIVKSITKLVLSVKKQFLCCHVIRYNRQKRWSSTKRCRNKPALELVIKENIF